MPNVVVALVNRQFYRESKQSTPIAYGPGLAEMPLEHAQEMGLLHRIRGVVDDKVEEAAPTPALPFDGVFDDKLTRSLTAAGYRTLDDLRKASQDAIYAVDGVGPAAFERIQNALRGA
ncbi:MAG: hypothetical protein DMF06_03435 [Verrucomicrobia bacterium]|nr:MAG: hypothetical protein DMF06_03435 [Verrucomicrobiota bacterium]